MRYITNAVLIPTLEYRLQTSVVTPSQLSSINRTIRKTIRSKYKIDTTLPNSYLYDPRLKMNIFDIQDRLEQNQITNSLIHLRTSGITNTVLKESLQLYKTQHNLPADIYQCPLASNHRNKDIPFIRHISNLLHKHDISFRNPSDEYDNNIFIQLPHKEYNKHYKQIQKHNLQSISDLTITNKKRNLRTQYQHRKLISYSNFFQRLNKTKKREFTKNDTQRTPKYYQEIIKTFCEKDQTKDISKVESTFNLKTMAQKPDIIQLDNEEQSNLHIWTDGSLFPNTDPPLASGAAIIRTDNNINTPSSHLAYTIPNELYPSSTTTEMAAIHIPLQTLPKDRIITIYTDSQSTIQAMETIQKNNLTERQLLKIPNHYNLQLNNHFYKEYTTPPMLVKVKGHSNNHWNNEADKLAKHTATLKSNIHNAHHCTNDNISQVYITAPRTVLEQPNMKFVYRNKNIIQKYPSKIIKTQYHNTNITKNNTYIQSVHLHNHDINIDKTFQLASFFPTDNFLDTSFMHEQKFRMKLQNKSLATKSNLRKRGILDQDTCPFCTSIETIDHLWNCTYTTSQIPQIFTQFKENLQTRHSIKDDAIDLSAIPEVTQIAEPLTINDSTLTNTDGIITNDMIQKTKLIPWPDNRRYLKSKSRTDLMFMILDCWYNALYRTIWIPRNQKIYQNTPTNDQEPRTHPHNSHRRNNQRTPTNSIPSTNLQRRRQTRLHNKYYRRTSSRKRKKSEKPTTETTVTETEQREPPRRIPIIIIQTNPTNPPTYTITQRNNTTS